MTTPAPSMCVGCVPSVASEIAESLRPVAFALHRALCPLDGYYLCRATDENAAAGWDLELWADPDEDHEPSSNDQQAADLARAFDALPPDFTGALVHNPRYERPVLLVRRSQPTCEVGDDCPNFATGRVMMCGVADCDSCPFWYICTDCYDECRDDANVLASFKPLG